MRLNPARKLATTVAGSTASLPTSGWHPLGSAWLTAGVLGIVLLVGLIYLLLYDWPALRNTATVMVSALVSLLGWLGWREDHDMFRRLSYLLAGRRTAQATLAFLLLGVVGAWGFAGVPKARSIICGPFGCKRADEIRLTIAEFKNLTPHTTEFGVMWTEGTCLALEEKLGLVPKLKIIGRDCQQVTHEVRTQLQLDYVVKGQFAKWNKPELTARLYDREFAPKPPFVTVRGDGTETRETILDLQHSLAISLLERLGIAVDSTLQDKMRRTPTSDPEALVLNNQGVALFKSQRYVEAETKFRSALERDPNYGDAYSNLAYALGKQGDYGAAVAAYESAIEQLPRNPVYYYNLGNLYALIDRNEDAINSLQEATSLDPSYVQAYNELGNVYLQLGRRRDARREFEKGLKLDSSFAPLHKNIGRVALAQGKPDEAVDSLQTAISLYGNDPTKSHGLLEATYWLAEAYEATGKYAAACEQLGEFWKVDSLQISKWARQARDLSTRLACK